MSETRTIDRRSFLRSVAAGGGWVLGITLTGTGPVLSRMQDGGEWKPDLFLALASDGSLTLIAHRSEMGTGIRTSLPMVLADEMDADWERVTVRQATADRRLGSQNTDGSRSQRNFFERMRSAGAEARYALIEAAAVRWDVPLAECSTEPHQVVHLASGRRLGYGALAATASDSIEVPLPQDPPLRFKAPHERRYVGKGVPITDMEAILDGSAQFGLDVKLPDMLVATIARSPVLGGHATRVDSSAAEALAGVVRVVEMPAASAPYAFKALGGVAVLAKNTWSAIKGRSLLEIEWENGAHANASTEAQDRAMAAAAAAPGRVVREHGEVDAALAAAEQVIEAEYQVPHLAHAPMEPPAAIARVSADACEVWACTQTPQSAQRSVAQALGMTPSQVTIHVTLLGGGFGRKSKPDYIVEAALLARTAGVPVQVFWSREDDIRHDYMHGASSMLLKAGLDGDGRSSAWLARSSFTPIGSTFSGTSSGSDGEMGQGFLDLLFDLPHLRVENCDAAPHLRIGWLRSVCNIFHAFAVGSFADELAHATGRDPVEHLLELIGPDRVIDFQAMKVNFSNYGSPFDRYPVDTGRLTAVLKRAAEMAEWGRKMPPGSGLGIAVHRSFCTYVATVVEVEIGKDGSLRIPKVDVAVDCGLAVHPDRVRAQMEGAAVFGTSLARYGKITTRNGAVEQGNFHDYRMARMADAPQRIAVDIMPSEEAPAGVGEPGVPPFAPALCNAVFAACAKRVRRLPLADHDLSWS